jgi:hypothetical protein
VELALLKLELLDHDELLGLLDAEELELVLLRLDDAELAELRLELEL